MSSVVRAAEVFFGYLAAIEWRYVGLALGFHFLKMAARAQSWRNILAASYPDATMRWRTVFGSYAAGVGVNALLPARGGDLLKLYLIRHRIEGAAYATLATTLVVETLFDFVLASALLLWALQQGVLPSVEVLQRLPEVEWLWLFQHPSVAAAVGAAALLVGFGLGLWASRRIELLRQRFRQGVAVLHPPRRYVRGVVPWQALDWGCRLTSIYFFLHAFGIAANPHNALLVQVTNSLSTALPLTPAGIGTEQALLVYVFAGTAPATAVLSLSVGMKFIVVAANAIVGFGAAALMLRTLRWRRVVAHAVADQQDSIEASDRPQPS